MAQRQGWVAGGGGIRSLPTPLLPATPSPQLWLGYHLCRHRFTGIPSCCVSCRSFVFLCSGDMLLSSPGRLLACSQRKNGVRETLACGGTEMGPDLEISSTARSCSPSPPRGLQTSLGLRSLCSGLAWHCSVGESWEDPLGSARGLRSALSAAQTRSPDSLSLSLRRGRKKKEKKS